jgi:ABC-type nitrate/sulfonate/bicarbonate transport system substrate-binding protein
MKCVFATPSRTLLAMPYWIAEDKGFFRDEGIDAALEIAPIPAIKDGLRAGALLMSIDSPEGFILDAAQGGNLRILAGSTSRPPLYLIVQPEIKRIAELKGKRFGVISLEEGSSQLIAKMMTAEGLSPGDYEVAQVGSAPVRAKLLAERAIDACLQPMPLQAEAEDAGFTNLAWAGTYEPDYQFSTINGVAGGDKAVKVAALRALLRGHRYGMAHPDEAARIVAEKMSTKVELIARCLQEAKRIDLFDEKLNVSERGLGVMIESLRAKGRIAGNTTDITARCVESESLSLAQHSLEMTDQNVRRLYPKVG